MNGSTPIDLPPLGRKIVPTAPPLPEPTWKPLRPGYETDGSSVRRIPSDMVVNPWEQWMKAMGRSTA